jgi:hypothetical protein
MTGSRRHRQHDRLSRDEAVNLIPDAVSYPLDPSSEGLSLRREYDLITLKAPEGDPVVYPVGTLDDGVTISKGARDGHHQAEVADGCA